MRIEEAIVYCLADCGYGLTTDRIAQMINAKRLHVRKDGNPVTTAQVYAVIMRFPETFVKSEGRIRLLI